MYSVVFRETERLYLSTRYHKIALKHLPVFYIQLQATLNTFKLQNINRYSLSSAVTLYRLIQVIPFLPNKSIVRVIYIVKGSFIKVSNEM